MSDFETVFYKPERNGAWEETQILKVPNRGMNFGDGIFETMVLDQGRIRFSEQHKNRLFRGLDILQIHREGVDFESLEDFLLESYPSGTFRVRWNLYRAGSGKYTAESNDCEEMLQVSAFRPAPQIKERCEISDRVRLSFSPWSECKTLNALPYVMAALERESRNLDELILLDQRGYLSEATASNLFWQIGDEVFTPSLSCGCISGTGRRVILDALREAGVNCREGEFLPQELKKADCVWVSNVTGISSIVQLGSKIYSAEIHPVLTSLFL
ncbi:aminotransferase class IV [Algoriphagus sp. CAU 1675]|uniref:aminotransferase class IV n=1 Tax=Algoriphagus sp. CAU 1675 TaxID=3032597 RepID=UPI0023D9CB1E|nr:aminotransferase class IV [Algoriphagus sp. CAU 1675]MDF2157666.1 aminotransferase class IV [Algoriphagus sp. CAU 1675]